MFSKHQKTTACLIALACASGLGLQAQAALSDSGAVEVNGQISTSTCLLNLGDAGSTGAGSKTLNLGTWSTGQVPSGNAGDVFGTAKSVVMNLADPSDPSKVCSISQMWDVGIKVQPNQYTSLGAFGYLNNGAVANAAQNLGVVLAAFTSATTTFGTPIKVNLLGPAASPTYGYLLSGNQTPGMGLPSNGVGTGGYILLTAQFARTSATSAPTPGAFSVTLPLNVWYK